MPRRYIGDDHFTRETRLQFHASLLGDPTRAGCYAAVRGGCTTPLAPCGEPIAFAGVLETPPTADRPVERLRAFSCQRHAEDLADVVPFGEPAHVAELARRQAAEAGRRWPITPDGRL